MLSLPGNVVNAHELTGQSLLDTTARHLDSPQSQRRTEPSLEQAAFILEKEIMIN